MALLSIATISIFACTKPAAPPTPAAPALGTITGVVRFEGTVPAKPPHPLPASLHGACGTEVPDRSAVVNDGQVAFAVVTTEGGPHGAPLADPTVDQQRCSYEPPVLVGRPGGTLIIKNSDPVIHNVRAQDQATTVFNVAMPLPQTIRRPLPATAEVMTLECDVHPWMHGWVRLTSRSHATTTSADGRFTLKQVAAGERTVEVWHPVLGVATARTQVPGDGGVAEVELTLRAP